MTRWARGGGVAGVVVALAAATSLAGAGDVHDYDAAGRLDRVTYGTGRIVDYTYDDNGNVTAIVSSTATPVEPAAGTPAFVNSLRPSEPNPASGLARVRFSLARGGKVTLRFFDVAGRLVHTAFARDYPRGNYEARVPIRSWPGGVYYYRLEAPGFRATRRLVVLK